MPFPRLPVRPRIMQTCVVVDCAYGCEKKTQEKAFKVEKNRWPQVNLNEDCRQKAHCEEKNVREEANEKEGRKEKVNCKKATRCPNKRSQDVESRLRPPSRGFARTVQGRTREL